MTENQLTPVWVVIPAAGNGQRMQSDLPKQYLKIQDQTLIEHTLNCFIEHKEVAGVLVVLSSSDIYWESLSFKNNANSKPLFAIKITDKSNLERSDSVIKGLEYLEQAKNIPPDSWVMVHDAARPCVTKSDIDSLLALRSIDSVGGILAAPVRDTMKRSVKKTDIDANQAIHNVTFTETRENLWHALTPQLFRLGELLKALLQCDLQNLIVTDECSAMENIGEIPQIVEGSHNNIKVTYPSDLELAAFLIGKNKETER